ncbi:MAG TPA: hypothetical protein VKZ53_12945 [Candidatus Angelobacter sp.]|nr:hypothetical protein [Candidatus Angelobacter sp.]
MRTIHLVESLSTKVSSAVTTNCGLLMTAKVVRINNWATGQCEHWLDGKDICEICRVSAMEPKLAQFTLGVVGAHQ